MLTHSSGGFRTGLIPMGLYLQRILWAHWDATKHLYRYLTWDRRTCAVWAFVHYNITRGCVWLCCSHTWKVLQVWNTLVSMKVYVSYTLEFMCIRWIHILYTQNKSSCVKTYMCMWSWVQPACSAGEAHTVMDDGMQSYECQQHDEAHCSVPLLTMQETVHIQESKEKETMYANS